LVFLPAGFLLYRGYAPADGSADAPSKNNDSWLKEILSILAPVATALPIAKLFDLIF